MLEPIFCKGIFYESTCVWSWRIIVGFVILVLLYKLLYPKKKPM